MADEAAMTLTEGDVEIAPDAAKTQGARNCSSCEVPETALFGRRKTASGATVAFRLRPQSSAHRPFIGPTAKWGAPGRALVGSGTSYRANSNPA
jgi:hypothetical protein